MDKHNDQATDQLYDENISTGELKDMQEDNGQGSNNSAMSYTFTQGPYNQQSPQAQNIQSRQVQNQSQNHQYTEGQSIVITNPEGQNEHYHVVAIHQYTQADNYGTQPYNQGMALRNNNNNERRYCGMTAGSAACVCYCVFFVCFLLPAVLVPSIYALAVYDDGVETFHSNTTRRSFTFPIT